MKIGNYTKRVTFVSHNIMKCNTVKKSGSKMHVLCRAALAQRHQHPIEDKRKECHLVKCTVVEHARVDLRSAGDSPQHLQGAGSELQSLCRVNFPIKFEQCSVQADQVVAIVKQINLHISVF